MAWYPVGPVADVAVNDMRYFSIDGSVGVS